MDIWAKAKAHMWRWGGVKNSLCLLHNGHSEHSMESSDVSEAFEKQPWKNPFFLFLPIPSWFMGCLEHRQLAWGWDYLENKNPTHTTSKHGSPGRCADLLQVFCNWKSWGLGFALMSMSRFPIWTIDAHVACEWMNALLINSKGLSLAPQTFLKENESSL